MRRSKWAARSLDILTELDAVARVSGRTVKVVVTPFTPPPELQRDGNGRPVVLLPGDTFLVTSRHELDTIAQEALRRRLEVLDET